ncbi:glycerol-3-phosphate dehydrogenase (NAD(P)+) [Legionella birminghamensis]|uniref:Glycerol-3-phosphate dehydrogenase [NAD(P)+] n=1 Tax=Legionella birminghamensis TaxID=28083 RepID=A0A378IDE5_9GAMM|nr:NAD(P)H-dependent glycerol-3-phosphate dehydrogenase [Legionella birminghamensis]KTC74321.1 glycerol-3-phosphate dehydrogenase (NAD(P)+) [Legionella birminghamensis]STX32561.1 glycerol-3-phosphate dehydrogenase (NAD(P)+) [Legionella birminghamensis]
MNNKPIAILGAGSWGTAVAIHMAKAGRKVMLWGRDPQHVASMKTSRCNQRYLPDVKLPDTLALTDDLQACSSSAGEVIIAVPSHSFSEIIQTIDKPATGISWLTKGLDPANNQFLSDIIAHHWGEHFSVAAISGPSFAREVAQGLPTALTLAGNNTVYQESIRELLHHQNVRVYLSNDLIGVQLCGAVKNVLAIACGISDGLHFGANAKAALITRGLTEMRRLGKVLGARDESFMGLAGVGDLVLTCTDDQSRNRRFGLHLGHGISAIEAEKLIGQVVEGKHNAAQICLLAERNNVEMPICAVVNRLLTGELSPQQAVLSLMSRSARDEE